MLHADGVPAKRQRPPAPLTGKRFTVLLEAPVVARSTHFLLQGHRPDPVATELPTTCAPDRNSSVDNMAAENFGLGVIVPKRHARRAVTRSLVKRQMREAAGRYVDVLRGGEWLLRLRAPFDSRTFPGAASVALNAGVRAELNHLLARLRR